MAFKRRYELGANRELIALGSANLAGALSGGFPVAGGFSRSAVSDRAGAKTTLTMLISALVVALTLIAFTPVFRYLPKAVLAAIVLVAVTSLIDIREFRRLWHVKRSDAWLWIFTLVCTVFVGVQFGIALGVTASLALFIARSTRPHTAILGRLSGRQVFRNLKNYPDAERFPGVVMLRMDATFYFGNVQFFKDLIDRILLRAREPLHAIVLDASAINDLDSSAEAALREVRQRLNERDIALYLANLKMPVYRILKRSGFIESLGKEYVCLDLPEAIRRLQTPEHADNN